MCQFGNFSTKTANINVKKLSVSPMLRPTMSETSKTARGLGYNRSHIRSMAQYSTKMIFAVTYIHAFIVLWQL